MSASTSAPCCAPRPVFDLPLSLRGLVDAIVIHPEKGELRYALRVQDGGLRYSEHPAVEAQARVRGPERAWVEAFGPSGSRTELEFEGDQQLAHAVLDAVQDRAAPRNSSARHAA